jgi:hypothetical protein
LADFNNNKFVVGEALKALKSSKQRISSSAFLQMPGIAKVNEVLQIAYAMGLIDDTKHKTITGLMQGGADANQIAKGKEHGNPMESYGYHGGSDDIIELVEDLMGQLRELHSNTKCV